VACSLSIVLGKFLLLAAIVSKAFRRCLVASQISAEINFEI